MTELLIKLFVKDRDDLQNKKVRLAYGNLGGITGIICNLLLFTVKLIFGIITASFSLIADAFNNFSDMGSSLITLFGFKLASKPADKDHPFGHGRFEYISALVVAFIITFVGIDLFKTSIEKIITPERPETNIPTVIVLISSILVKLWLALFNTKLGKIIDSDSLRATAKDSLNDCFATGAVLLSVICLICFDLNIDAYVGLIVSAFIIYSGINSVKETVDPLLGGPASKDDIEAIAARVREVPIFIGIHDLIIHNYGPGRTFCSLHVEVPEDIDIILCHEEIDSCEKRILTELGIETVIHMDPVAVGDPYIDEVKEIFSDILSSIDPELTFHDFRIVKGEKRTNVIFDVVVPHGMKMGNDKLLEQIQTLATGKDPKFCCVITVDNSY